jgi:hypothetical protein
MCQWRHVCGYGRRLQLLVCGRLARPVLRRPCADDHDYDHDYDHDHDYSAYDDHYDADDYDDYHDGCSEYHHDDHHDTHDHHDHDCSDYHDHDAYYHRNHYDRCSERHHYDACHDDHHHDDCSAHDHHDHDAYYHNYLNHHHDHDAYYHHYTDHHCGSHDDLRSWKSVCGQPVWAERHLCAHGRLLHVHLLAGLWRRALSVRRRLLFAERRIRQSLPQQRQLRDSRWILRLHVSAWVRRGAV